jgi:hypothetical protein
MAGEPVWLALKTTTENTAPAEKKGSGINPKREGDQGEKWSNGVLEQREKDREPFII